MHNCERCNGEGVTRRPRPMMGNPKEPEPLIEEVCQWCRGEGRVTEMRQAILDAAGGPPSTERRGYA